MSKHLGVAALILPVSLLLLYGCSPRQSDVGTSVAETEPPAVQIPRENIVPLPGIAEDRPAPADTLGLDRAETAQAAKPDGSKENMDLAFSYYKAKAYADAVRAFDRAARLMPSDPKPLLYLGYTQMAVGALEPAVTTFQRVTMLKGAPRDTISEAYLQIGNAEGAMGHDEKAAEAFSKSLGNNPKNGMASLALGAWAAQHNRFAQARDFLRDAANDLPPDRHRAQAHAALGRLAEEQKDATTASVEYKKSLALDEDNAWAKAGLKRVATKKG
jgi:tetratricopeptide (TPR) repeat protein